MELETQADFVKRLKDNEASPAIIELSGMIQQLLDQNRELLDKYRLEVENVKLLIAVLTNVQKNSTCAATKASIHAIFLQLRDDELSKLN